MNNKDEINIDEFIDNFPFELEDEGDSYVYLSDNLNDFSKIYLYIDSYTELQSQESFATESMTTLLYTDGNYEITLSADLINNKYICRIGER